MWWAATPRCCRHTGNEQLSGQICCQSELGIASENNKTVFERRQIRGYPAKKTKKDWMKCLMMYSLLQLHTGCLYNRCLHPAEVQQSRGKHPPGKRSFQSTKTFLTLASLPPKILPVLFEIPQLHSGTQSDVGNAVKTSWDVSVE